MDRNKLTGGLFFFGIGLYIGMIFAAGAGGPGFLANLVPILLILAGSDLIANAFPKAKPNSAPVQNKDDPDSGLNQSF